MSNKQTGPSLTNMGKQVPGVRSTEKHADEEKRPVGRVATSRFASGDGIVSLRTAVSSSASAKVIYIVILRVTEIR